MNCCFAGPKALRRLWAEHSLHFSSWFPRVHRSSRRVLCGSGAGFWVFSLGILHGMRLIVKGDFLTNISHILLRPQGLVRNQMTAWALRFGRRREVRAKQPCMSPQQHAALLCQSAATNAATAALGSIVCALQTRWCRTGGNYFTQVPQWWSADRQAANGVYAPLINSKHRKGSGAIYGVSEPERAWAVWGRVSVWTQLLLYLPPVLLF